MTYSRSGSRGSLESQLANRPKEFRMMHRNRSNHYPTQPSHHFKRIDSDSNIPTESRLQKLLSASPSPNKYAEICQSLSSDRRSLFNQESQLLNRRKVSESRLSKKSNTQLISIPDKESNTQKVKNETDAQRMPRFGTRLQSSLSRASIANEVKRASKMRQAGDLNDLQSIETKLDELINKKLELFNENSYSLQQMNAAEFVSRAASLDQELQVLLQNIMQLKASKEHSIKEDQLINKKIQYLQNLLGENSIEMELMKKKYLAHAAKKNRTIDLSSSKIKIASDSLSLYERQHRNQIVKTEATPNKDKKHWYFNERSTNKADFRVPNPEDYESFRFQPKPASLNRQPLPRSSYNRDYLIVKTEPSEKIVAKDNSDVFPKFFHNLISNYSKQYTKHKTELRNHKDMDARRDKLKFINFSYASKKIADNIVKSKERIRKPEREDSLVKKAPLSVKAAPIYSSQTEPRISKAAFVSEARRQFVWENGSEKSMIKHKHLKQFQYRLKNLYKA